MLPPTPDQRRPAAETALAWASNPLVWPLPPLLVSGLILLCSGRAWADKLPSRRGLPMSVAEGSIKLSLAGLALYGFVLVVEKTGLFADGGASEAQQGCALVLLKLFTLSIPYLCCANLVVRYVFG